MGKQRGEENGSRGKEERKGEPSTNRGGRGIKGKEGKPGQAGRGRGSQKGWGHRPTYVSLWVGEVGEGGGGREGSSREAEGQCEGKQKRLEVGKTSIGR